MKEEELKCTYRSPANFFSLLIAIVFLAGAIWATVKLRDSKMGVVIIAAFLCTMYFVLRIVNSKVVLAQEKISRYSLWNRKSEYDIEDITKIAVANQLQTKYIKICFGDKKILVRKDIKNYDKFLKTICERLRIKGYTRGGVSEFVIKKEV